MKSSLRTTELAQLVSVTPQTIRKWIKNGDIPYHQTPGGNLYFTEEDVKQITGESIPQEKPRAWWYYIRSSSGSKQLKRTQKEQLSLKYPHPDKIVQDNGSGLNENRSGLKKIFAAAENGELTDLAITTKDRLTRFGYSYIERYLANCGVTVHVLNDKDTSVHAPEEELLSDFMALIASFSGRFYRLRTKENQKRLLNRAQEELDAQTK